MAHETLSWREQLSQARETITDQEKQRTEDKRLKRERSESALRERLTKDTPQALRARSAELRKQCDHAARQFCPFDSIAEQIPQIQELLSLLRFYKESMPEHPKVFAGEIRPTILKIHADLANLLNGLERQLKQWRGVQPMLEQAVFRPRMPADDMRLVPIAKEFNQRAYDIVLSIPSDYFSKEGAGFWVVACDLQIVGYIKFESGTKTLNFAFKQIDGINFNKFVRGALHRFCRSGPLPEPLDAVRVRLSFLKEVKYYTAMGFQRSETHGPSEWTYERKTI